MKQVLMAVLLASVIILALSFPKWSVYEIKEVPIEVTVEQNTIGFNTNTDKLAFGTVAPDGSSDRKASIDVDHPTTVIIKVVGPLSSWVSVSENHFPLDPGQTKEVNFRLRIPANTTLGNYTSTARIEYRRRLW